MKILSNSNVEKVTCPCGSVLEIEIFDVECTVVFGHGTSYEVVCPVCYNIFNVENLKNNIPDTWKDRLYRENDPEED